MQAKIADMYTETNAARAYVYVVAAACDADRTTRIDAAGCILYAAERATQHALQAVQALGGNGYINDYPAARLLRDAKLYEIGAGTSEIRRMLIGRELFDATLVGEAIGAVGPGKDANIAVLGKRRIAAFMLRKATRPGSTPQLTAQSIRINKGEICGE